VKEDFNFISESEGKKMSFIEVVLINTLHRLKLLVREKEYLFQALGLYFFMALLFFSLGVWGTVVEIQSGWVKKIYSRYRSYQRFEGARGVYETEAELVIGRDTFPVKIVGRTDQKKVLFGSYFKRYRRAKGILIGLDRVNVKLEHFFTTGYEDVDKFIVIAPIELAWKIDMASGVYSWWESDKIPSALRNSARATVEDVYFTKYGVGRFEVLESEIVSVIGFLGVVSVMLLSYSASLGLRKRFVNLDLIWRVKRASFFSWRKIPQVAWFTLFMMTYMGIVILAYFTAQGTAIYISQTEVMKYFRDVYGINELRITLSLNFIIAIILVMSLTSVLIAFSKERIF